MNGLIYKEVCMFKSQFKSWVLGLGILCIYGFILKSMVILLMMTALMGLISCLTSFTYDKTYRCDEYVAAMPLSRKKIVVSKYVFLLILDVALTLLTGAVAVIAGSLFNEGLETTLGAAVGVLGATIFLQAVVMPIIYAFGPEKARFVFVVIGITPYIVLMLLKDKIAVTDLGFLKDYLWILPILLVAVIAVSIWISVRIYGKKDL